MTPVINPIWFYLTDVIGGIKDVLDLFNFIFIVAAIAIVLIVMLGLGLDDCCGDDAKRILQYSKQIKKLTLCFIVSVFVNCILPSEETMYKIMLAQNVTYENVETAGDVIKDSVDYIFEKFNGEEQK